MHAVSVIVVLGTSIVYRIRLGFETLRLSSAMRHYDIGASPGRRIAYLRCALSILIALQGLGRVIPPGYVAVL